MDRNRYNQDPNNLSYRYERRARVAAWAAGLSLLGATTIFEVSEAQAAGASAEVSNPAENAQAFIDKSDKQLAKIESRLKGLKNFKVINGKAIKQSADVNIYYATAPNSTNPNLYDLLEVTVKGKANVPLFSSVSLGANSNKPGKITNSPDGIVLMQAANPKNIFTPGSMEVWTDHGVDFAKYCVSTTNYDGNHPQFGETTGSTFSPTSPSVVSKQFNTFFQYANKILDANSPPN